MILCSLGGCGGDSGPGPEPSHERRYCQAICATTRRCLYPVVSDCIDLCVQEHYAWMSQLDPDAANAVAECMLERPCSEVENWEHEPWCWDLVSATQSPTDAVIEFCETLSPVWFDCGYQADLIRCAESFHMWGRDILTEAMECASAPSCEEVEQCLDNTFDF